MVTAGNVLQITLAQLIPIVREELRIEAPAFFLNAPLFPQPGRDSGFQFLVQH